MSSFEDQGVCFIDWLKRHGTTLSDSIALYDYRKDGAGRGVIATKDIKEGELLFSLPRSILLSQLTTALNQVEGLKDDLKALSGWSPLILALMYESQKDDSFWKPYFDVLPRTFYTPMFWNESDLKELEGTDVVSKIGKEDAETLFQQEIKPLIEKYPNVFDSQIHTIDLFHTCGSLIMAYSFNDELQKQEKKQEGKEEEEDEELEEEEEEEDQGLISMVPMADMLNHKTGYNNARLFHETDSLQMRAIKDIKEGEQIFNTYGDLCNADLLRKYGFTDENNPYDLVELDGPLVVDICCQNQPEELKEKKIDFLMEEGVLDECFVIDTEHEIPPELIVSVHVLKSAEDDFKKMEEKQKLPKPKLTKDVKESIKAILEKRLSRYPTTLEEDETEFNSLESSSHKKNAFMVRMGEKKILASTLKVLESMPVVQLTEKRPASTQHKQNKKQRK